MKYINGTIEGRFCILRQVTEDDAAFIVELRTDPKLSQHISRTQASAEAQRKWIIEYKKRNGEGLEYYFIVCDFLGNRWGTVRLYDIKGDECTGGSWVVKRGAPLAISLESYLAPMELAFSVLGLNVIHLDVRKENRRVLQWHESCGAIFDHEDELNRYYDYTPAIYPQALERVYKLLSPVSADAKSSVTGA